MSTIEEALAKERKSINFPVQKVAEFLYEKHIYEKMKNGFERLPQIPHDFNLFNRGRVQIIKQTFRDFPKIYNATGKEPISDYFYTTLAYTNQLPGSAHIAMFTKCIQIMGTEEQSKQYLAKSRNYDIIGCYAQTELGHGSDVRGLLTTATFNPQKDEFIISTPSIEAAKYWPGDLGILATHALIYAELIIKGKKHGIHPFIIEIRDKDRNPLPGIEVGDIGPKIGFHSKDNGYLFIKNISIPRSNMLQRFVEVTRDGELKITGNPNVGYATMMEIRKIISYGCIKLYSCAITIATRYSMFRKQFQNSAKEEIKIMDYQLQQEKIIDRVAEYFAITMTGNNIKNLCEKNLHEVTQNNNYSLMQETHICLCLGKTFSSEIVYNGMEICRKACGGHGFSQYSGFPALINEYAAHMTHEGQNTVLYLQIARYLMKHYKNLLMDKKELPQSLKYIGSYQFLLSKKCQVENYSQWSLDDLRIILAQGVCYMLQVISEKMVSKPDNVSSQQVWNEYLGVRLQKMALFHSIYYNYNSLREAIVNEKDEKIKLIAEKLCKLFGANMILTHSSFIIEGGFISPVQITSLKKLKEKTLNEIRPDLIGVVDGFGIPDKFIRSALISGNPYENYLKLARENEINHEKLESAKVVLQIKNHIRNPNPKL